jgi:prephenate dehydratase
MKTAIAHLGPAGTFSESAAIAYANYYQTTTGQTTTLHPCPSIAQAFKAALKDAEFAVVPVENSIEGGVTFTLDSLWQLDGLQIQQALVLPITHALVCHGAAIAQITQVYSHPQALAQCQMWLEANLPLAQQIAANSSTESVTKLRESGAIAAITSLRAAALYDIPILAQPINDNLENCTRFLVLSRDPSPGGNHTSLAFSVPANVPGALVNVLQILAERGVNMSRIESRPTKRSLGDYVFFIDIEANAQDTETLTMLRELQLHTELLKILGSYDTLPIAELP